MKIYMWMLKLPNICLIVLFFETQNNADLLYPALCDIYYMYRYVLENNSNLSCLSLIIW